MADRSYTVFYLNLIFPNLLDEFWDKTILEKFNWSPEKFQELKNFYDSFITPSYLRNEKGVILLPLNITLKLSSWIFDKLESIMLRK